MKLLVSLQIIAVIAGTYLVLDILFFGIIGPNLADIRAMEDRSKAQLKRSEEQVKQGEELQKKWEEMYGKYK